MPSPEIKTCNNGVKCKNRARSHGIEKLPWERGWQWRWQLCGQPLVSGRFETSEEYHQHLLERYMRFPSKRQKWGHTLGKKNGKKNGPVAPPKRPRLADKRKGAAASAAASAAAGDAAQVPFTSAPPSTSDAHLTGWCRSRKQEKSAAEAAEDGRRGSKPKRSKRKRSRSKRRAKKRSRSKRRAKRRSKRRSVSVPARARATNDPASPLTRPRDPCGACAGTARQRP